jgi:hypothetical protein
MSWSVEVQAHEIGSPEFVWPRVRQKKAHELETRMRTTLLRFALRNAARTASAVKG